MTGYGTQEYCFVSENLIRTMSRSAVRDYVLGSLI